MAGIIAAKGGALKCVLRSVSSFFPFLVLALVPNIHGRGATGPNRGEFPLSVASYIPVLSELARWNTSETGPKYEC